MRAVPRGPAAAFRGEGPRCSALALVTWPRGEEGLSWEGDGERWPGGPEGGAKAHTEATG